MNADNIVLMAHFEGTPAGFTFGNVGILWISWPETLPWKVSLCGLC